MTCQVSRQKQDGGHNRKYPSVNTQMREELEYYCNKDTFIFELLKSANIKGCQLFTFY